MRTPFGLQIIREIVPLLVPRRSSHRDTPADVRCPPARFYAVLAKDAAPLRGLN